jgi:hypothetical protein
MRQLALEVVERVRHYLVPLVGLNQERRRRAQRTRDGNRGHLRWEYRLRHRTEVGYHRSQSYPGLYRLVQLFSAGDARPGQLKYWGYLAQRPLSGQILLVLICGIRVSFVHVG